MEIDMNEELKRLRSELEKKDLEIQKLRSQTGESEQRAEDLKGIRTAMLYMLEDLNRSSEAVFKSKEEWLKTVDTFPDPLFVHDAGYRIVRANRAYAEAAGMSFGEFIGKPYYKVFPKMPVPFRRCTTAIEEKKENEEEDLYQSASGRTYRVRFFPVFKGTGEYESSTHIMEDITDAVKAEKKIKEEMEITSRLLMMAEAISGKTDIDELMEEVVSCGRLLTGSDICLSYLFDKDIGMFSPSMASGLSHDALALFKAEPLSEDIWFAKDALVSKRACSVSAPLHRNGLHEKSAVNTSPLSWIDGINKLLIIPLIGRSECVGMVLAFYADKKSFTEREYEIADGMSRQVSTVLEEARLYRDSIDKALDLSHKIETIRIMHEIDKSILSVLDRDELLKTVVGLVKKAIPCDRSVAFLVDRERGGVTNIAGLGQDSPEEGFVSFNDTIAREVVSTQRPQILPDFGKIKNMPPMERRCLDMGCHSCIRCPLVVRGEVSAILCIGSNRKAAFTPDDLSTLEKLGAQIGVAMENSRLVSDLEELFLATVKSLSSAIDAKSPWTAGHSERVTAYALLIGEAMDLSGEELKGLELAGILHDIGKIGVSETILDKPGKLNDEELGIIRAHPAIGDELLRPIKQLGRIIPAMRHHHENYDGSGYPDGLAGEDIPLHARILAVADTIDAMGADRPYRKGRSADIIAEELKRCSGTQFDPAIVDVFLQMAKEKGQEFIRHPNIETAASGANS